MTLMGVHNGRPSSVGSAMQWPSFPSDPNPLDQGKLGFTIPSLSTRHALTNTSKANTKPSGYSLNSRISAR